MKNEIMQRIASVINALENVTVKGKQNCGNIVGSITILEDISVMLKQCEVSELKQNEEVG